MLDEFSDCEHGEGARGYCFGLAKAVEEAFIEDPSIKSKDLSGVLDKVPDPPRGCKAAPMPAEFYSGGGNEEAFDCPFQPMTIRNRLASVAEELHRLNDRMVHQFFGKGDGSA
jgi:hypothetical protein